MFTLQTTGPPSAGCCKMRTLKLSISFHIVLAGTWNTEQSSLASEHKQFPSIEEKPN